MNYRHILLALLCAFLWGANFAVIKWGLQDIPALAFASLRFGTVALLAFFCVRPTVPVAALMRYGIGWGTLQFGGLFLAIHAGMPTGLASVLAQSQAIFTLLFAALAGHDALRPFHYLAILTAFTGITAIAVDQSAPIPPLALLLSLSGAAGWAYGNLAIRRFSLAGHRVDTIGFVAWASIIPALTLALLSAVFEDPARLAQLEPAGALRAAVAVLYQAGAALLFGTLVWNSLLRHYPAPSVAPFSLVVPVVGLSLGVLLLNETISVLQGIGYSLLLAALAINLLGLRSGPHAQESGERKR